MGPVEGAAQQAEQAGQDVRRSDGLDRVVRFGMVVYGGVNLVIAWLALRLAFGERGTDAGATGALRAVAAQPAGAVLLWSIAVGMAALVLWRLLEAVLGHRDEDRGERWKHCAADLLKAALYGAIAVSAVRVALDAQSSGGGGGNSGGGGGGGGGRNAQETLTAQLMQVPGGQLLVGAVGVAVIGYGLAQVRLGLSGDHAEKLAGEGRSGQAGTAYLLLGKVGYCAKGVAVGVVGSLFVYAAITHSAERSGGLDEALRQVLQQPFGPWLLAAVALGIGCYGLFCLARSRHLSR